MNDTDLDLLARYTGQKSEDAFAEIVRRHLNLVFSAALRQVRSAPLAEEVAQSTFVCLARDAHHLAPDTILPAWLYQVAHRTGANVVRREARRQVRERIASELIAMNATNADWTHIEPVLDEAMQALDPTDRAVVLLRYFENKPLREVGQAIGASENAAQKRLTRAVDRLRDHLARRGLSVAASALVVIISTNAVQAAPLGLAAAVTTAAMPVMGGGALLSAKVSMKLLKLKTVGAVFVLFLLGVGAYLAWNQSDGSGLVAHDAETSAALSTEEQMYQEMIAAYPIASEMATGHPTRELWEDRKSALLQAGYIEPRVIRFQKPLSGRKAADAFFVRFHARFHGVEVSLSGLNRATPPVASVMARRTDFGPAGAIEQFIRDYDSEKP